MKIALASISLAAVVLGTSVSAGGRGGNPAVKARQAHMQLYGFNLGALGAMAKGEVEYDAEAAKALAGNFAALAAFNQAAYWTPGTSNAELGNETRALPKIWEAGSTAGQISQELAAAAAELAAVAGDGQAALGAAIGAAGKACGDCHKAYRAPAN